VPEPLHCEERWSITSFIRMPDSTGFGDYTETGRQPGPSRAAKGGYTHCMFLNDSIRRSPAAAELGAFPKKLASPSLRAEIDTLVAPSTTVLRGGDGTMGYKHRGADLQAVKAALSAPTSAQDHPARRWRSPGICGAGGVLPRGHPEKGALTGPAALSLTPIELAPVAEFARSGSHLGGAHPGRSDPGPR